MKKLIEVLLKNRNQDVTEELSFSLEKLIAENTSTYVKEEENGDINEIEISI